MNSYRLRHTRGSTGLGTKLLLVVVVVVAAVFGRETVRFFMARIRGDSPVPAASAWTTQKLRDISLEAPVALSPNSEILGELPAAIRDALASYEMVDSGESLKGFRVTVSRIAYKPEVQVSLEGAVNGAMTQGAGAAGDSSPKFTSTPATIDGLVGRRAKYRRVKSGRSFHLEGLFAQHGQTIWQVQVIYLDAAASDAERLFSSVHITPSR